MVIGIDFDGTIIDTNRAKSEWIAEKTGRQIAPYHCDRTRCVPLIGADAYREMGRYVYSESCTLSLHAIDGALSAIDLLRKTHAVVVITARSGRTLESASCWLESHHETRGLQTLGLSPETSKLDVCRTAGAQVLIDDDERHLRPFTNTAARPILFKQNAPESESFEIDVVCRTWAEIVKRLASQI